MQINLTEAMCTTMEYTVIPAIAESKTLGDLIDNFDCLDFFIGYEDSSGRSI